MDELLDIVKACRRSRVKVRVWRALVTLKVAVVAELADFAQTTPDRVLSVLYGDGDSYRHDSALLSLGLVREQQRGQDDAFAITLRGEAAWEPVIRRLEKTRGPPEG
jgi:predicted transcriptional regulator with HTH domain